MFFIVDIGDANTSDIFTDDSFFSDSILLNTQAMESEATVQLEKYLKDSDCCQPLITKRKSFELENTTGTSENLKETRSKTSSHNPNEKHIRDQSIYKTVAGCSPHKLINNNIVQKPVQFIKKPISSTGKVVSKDIPKVIEVSAKAIHQRLHQQHNETMKKASVSAIHYKVSSKRIVDESNFMKRPNEVSLPACTSTPRKPVTNSINSSSCDLFGDDDDDDDLLCAIAEEVESKYGIQTLFRYVSKKLC